MVLCVERRICNPSFEGIYGRARSISLAALAPSPSPLHCTKQCIKLIAARIIGEFARSLDGKSKRLIEISSPNSIYYGVAGFALIG